MKDTNILNQYAFDKDNYEPKKAILGLTNDNESLQ